MGGFARFTSPWTLLWQSSFQCRHSFGRLRRDFSGGGVTPSS
jgi:hypothetical protein